MKVNLLPQIDKEINDVIQKLIENKNFQQHDENYLEVETPFVINPDSRNKEWINKIGIVLYPELLTYMENKKYVTIPWIAVRIEIEDTFNDTRQLLKWIVDIFKNIGYVPFHDEDATVGYYKKRQGKGYAKYELFINPDYPNGYWENHVLD